MHAPTQPRRLLALLTVPLAAVLLAACTPDTTRGRVEHDISATFANQYEQSEQVVQYYMSNKNLYRQIESLVIEDQVINMLLEQAKTSQKDMRFSELIEANQKAA